MMKILTVLSKIILIVAFLNIFAFSVYYIENGGKDLGLLTKPLHSFASFPQTIVNVFKETAVKPERLVKSDEDFQSFNRLDYNLYALNAFFDSSKWIIRLSNLKNDSIVMQWNLKEDHYLNSGRVFSHSEPRLPILLSDKSILVSNDESFNLFRLDENSNVIWKNNEHQFHHGMNLDNEGNVWVPTRKNTINSNTSYWDNYITKIDVNSGKTLYNKSLSDIFHSNNMGYIIHGYGNSVTPGLDDDDPFHLNDIEPIMKDGKYWKEGDLFLSLRHRSMIILYRPSTDKILKIIQGPFYNQHDVDILSDTTISFFNNNVSSLESTIGTQKEKRISDRSLHNQNMNYNSEVLVYNLNDSTFTSLYPNEFKKNKAFTLTEGLHHITAKGDLFIESQNKGKIYIFGENGTILKEYYNKRNSKGIVEPTHWIRIYEDLNFLNK